MAHLSLSEQILAAVHPNWDSLCFVFHFRLHNFALVSSTTAACAGSSGVYDRRGCLLSRRRWSAASVVLRGRCHSVKQQFHPYVWPGSNEMGSRRCRPIPPQSATDRRGTVRVSRDFFRCTTHAGGSAPDLVSASRAHL